MVREVLTVSVGQCGVQIGYESWKLFCAEHGVAKDGCPDKDSGFYDAENVGFDAYFFETSKGRYIPRQLTIDLEHTTVNRLRTGEYRDLFRQQDLVSAPMDAGDNFARGYYTIGKEHIKHIHHLIRKQVEMMDCVQGFVINHSTSGGTGTGTGMLVLEKLMIDHRKIPKIGMEVYPSKQISNTVIESINAMLTTHHLLDFTDVSIVMDNAALYQLATESLRIKAPKYADINKIIAKICSSMSVSIRFPGELNQNMNELFTNLVPFPRLHFMTSSFAPFMNDGAKPHTSTTIRHLTDFCFDPRNFTVSFPDFDIAEDKYMACTLQYRGNMPVSDAVQGVNWIFVNKAKLNFVDWCPTGFKIGSNENSIVDWEGDKAVEYPVNCCMIGNNLAISRLFQERLVQPFDIIYSQRAYVYHYVKEGMEEGEFSEAREDLGFLEKDYLDVVAGGSDEEAEDEEY